MLTRLPPPLALAAMLMLTGPAAQAQQDDGAIADEPSETTETFGAWTVRCQAGGAAGRACEIVHTVQGQGGAIARIAIGAPPGEDTPLIVVVTPLGVLVSDPVTLRADPATEEGAAPIAIPFATCLQTGCVARTATDPGQLAALAEGAQAQIAFTEHGGRAIEIAIPLTGLGSALRRLPQ